METKCEQNLSDTGVFICYIPLHWEQNRNRVSAPGLQAPPQGLSQRTGMHRSRELVPRGVPWAAEGRGKGKASLWTPRLSRSLSHSKDKKVILSLYHDSHPPPEHCSASPARDPSPSIPESMLIHCSSHNATLGHAGQVALVHRARRRNVKGRTCALMPAWHQVEESIMCKINTDFPTLSPILSAQPPVNNRWVPHVWQVWASFVATQTSSPSFIIFQAQV